MKNRIYVSLCVIVSVQSCFGIVATPAVPAAPVSSAASLSGVIFQGMTESGVNRNTFLCGYSSVNSSQDTGHEVSGADCTVGAIQSAIGFDVSGGRTLQFFNNFTYWLRKKSEKEQAYRIDTPTATDGSVDAYMESDGWGSMGAYCIIVSTNEIMQEVVGQGKQASAGEIKVVVQLWYNGDSLIQLWSQDVAILNPGQSFTIAISNAVDSALPAMLQATSGIKGYLKVVGKSMQPDNRKKHSYNDATNSPRTVRILVS